MTLQLLKRSIVTIRSMRIEPFRLERYFAKYEFSTRYVLSASDCETWGVSELLSFATVETRTAWHHLRLGYTESQGHPGLRLRVAALYESVTPEQVLVAAPEEAIFILMHALLEPGDRVVVLTPAYQSLYEVACSLECDVARMPLEVTGDSWTLDVDRFRDLVTPATRLIVVNFPHNPTGYLPPRSVFDKVLEIARKNECWLLGDEMYRLLEFDAGSRLPAVCDAYESGISLSGLSKSFGLPGLRVGWLVARDETVIRRCLGIKDYTTICNSAASEVLGMMGIDAREQMLARNREIVLNNLEAARGFFTAPDFQWLEPRAGSVAFPVWTGAGSAEEFCRKALQEKEMMIVPRSLFDWPGNHFRVGLGRRDFRDALGRLSRGSR